MNYTSIKTLCAAICVMSCVTPPFAVAESDLTATVAPKKMMLKIASVETAGMRLNKAWDPPMKPAAAKALPHSNAEIQNALPEEAAKMRAKNEAVRDANYAANAAIAWKNWEAANAHMQACRTQLEGSGYGRQIILAIDKFAGECGTYFDPDFIEFFHRLDLDEGIKEQYVQDMTSPDILAAPYFIKLIFDDPREESGTVSLNGNDITMTKYTLNITCQVQDLSGKMVFAKNVKQVKTLRRSNAIDYSGTDGNDLIDTLEEGLSEVAKAINERFVARVNFELSGPPNDDEFDESAGTVVVDGDEHSVGDEFAVLAGQHKVEVRMDGYKRSGASNMALTKSATYKIKMVSAMCEVTIKLKGAADDTDFDPATAQITLSGADDFMPSADEVEKIPQGTYKLTVSVPGYKTYTQEKLVLAANKKTVPVQLVKEKKGLFK